MNIWTIYNSPSDFTGFYVARRFVLDHPTGDCLISKSLEELRKHFIQGGFVCLKRAPSDPAPVVETWF